MAKKLSPEAREALEGFLADVLLNVMIGMVKAIPSEAEFAKIREAAKKLTTEQMQRIATIAGKRYAEACQSVTRQTIKRASRNP